MARYLRLTALSIVALAAAPLPAQPHIPDRRPLVMDAANVISADKEQLLTSALAGFRQTQQREVSIVTVPDLQGYAIDDYTRQLRIASGLDTYNDDGAVLLVVPGEMKARIELGSRVKSILPDDAARQIVETWMLPRFAQGDMDQGILDGTGSVLGYLELPPEQAAAIAEQARLEAAEREDAERFPWGSLAVVILLAVLWSLVRRGGLFRVATGAVTLLGGGSDGSGRGRSGGFGGFGGGGGGFNGGGASGRW